jgi:hypothetical protein
LKLQLLKAEAFAVGILKIHLCVAITAYTANNLVLWEFTTLFSAPEGVREFLMSQ